MFSKNKENCLLLLKTLEENEAPKWTKADSIKVMEKMVSSELGMIEYNCTCKLVGQEVMNSMIEYNLIHMRPISWLSFDFPINERAII